MKNSITRTLLAISFFLLISSTTLNAQTYCDSSGTNTNYEWIESIEINGESYISGDNQGYLEHDDSPILQPGTNTITLNPGYPGSVYTEHWRGWIDLNGDSVFSPDEKVIEFTGRNATTLDFNIPAGTESSITKMRVVMQYGNLPNPCGNFTYGETEDFFVSIEGEDSETYSYRLTLDYDFLVRRSGSIGDNLIWVIEENGEIKLQRNASGELEYKYFRRVNGNDYRVWLIEFINGQYQQVSNIVEYTPGITDRYELTLLNNFEVQRSGSLGDNLQWVIEKDGEIVLERNAANELNYTYFNNTEGSTFRVWLKQFLAGEYKVVSNIVEYEVGQNQFSLSVDQLFEITRNGQLGDDVQWVIEENGEVVLERNAANELNYTYFNNAPGTSYRVWLQMFIDGQYQIVSNIVEYTVPESYPYTLNLGANYEVFRTGNLGDNLTWVIVKNGEIVLQRYAGNELSYTYFSNTLGSIIQIYLEKFNGSFYEPVSNVVQYTVE